MPLLYNGYKILDNNIRKRLRVWPAKRAASSILNGSNLLKTSPNIGKPMPDKGDRREFFIAFGAGAYVIRNKLEDENTLIIIRIWHSRKNRPRYGDPRPVGL